MPAILETIPDGQAGLQVKLQRLRSMVDTARRDPAFRRLAVGLVSGVGEKDWSGEIRAVSRFVRGMRYTRDPVGVEMFTDPRILAAQLQGGQVAAGDCDDATGLGAALLESIGHATRFRVGGFRDGNGGVNWSHIWLEVLHPSKGWRPLDDTAKRHPAGFDPSGRFEATMHEHENTRQQRFGGAFAASLGDGLGELDGLKLKKVLKKAVAAVPKVAQAIAVKPMRTVATLTRKVPVVGKLTGAIAKVEDTQRAIMAKARRNPLVQAASAVVPGVGPVLATGLRIASTVEAARRDDGAGEQVLPSILQAGQQLVEPFANLLPQDPPRGGGGSPGVYEVPAYGREQLYRGVAYAAVGVAGLLLVFMVARRK